MKRTFLLFAALLSALSVVSVAHAQNTSAAQQDAQAAQTSTSNTEYGGVTGNTSAMGSATYTGSPRQATCGHLPQCGPNAGH
jgi:cell division protein FtsL